MSRDSMINRARWDENSDEYQRRHGEQLARAGLAWGTHSIPESELGILGDVVGRDVLEIGCGAAQLSIELAKIGARPAGIDNSARQLEHARRLMAEAGVDFPLLHCSAEAVPLPDSSFDVVFCDHGAMSFADPYVTVPEAVRLLRHGGRFAFNMTTAFVYVCVDREEDAVGTALRNDYFGMHRVQWQDGDVEFELPYGEWIRLFRGNGLEVLDLVELRPPPGASTTYDVAPDEWARRWPAENIWVTRKG